MSQVSHPTISLPTRMRSHRAVTLAWLLALVAAVAVFVVIVTDNDAPGGQQSVGAGQALSAPRTDGNRSESGVAAAVGTRATPFPDENSTAASVAGASTRSATGRDETRVAEAVGGGSPTSAGAPDESHTAVSISGR